MKKVVAMEFPGKFREEDSYPGWSGITAATPASGFQTSGKVAWEMEPSVRDYFVRRAHREPLAILKARGEKGFVAIAGGKTKVGETDVEELLIGIRGATTTLYVEPKTGRVLRATYRDRAGGAIGEVTRTFSDFRKVDGLTLPYGIATAYNGKTATNPAVTTDAIAINPKSDASLFTKPD